MPQMYPMMWMSLYIYFFLLFTILMIKLFFIFNKQIKQKNKKIQMKNFNMKW